MTSKGKKSVSILLPEPATKKRKSSSRDLDMNPGGRRDLASATDSNILDVEAPNVQQDLLVEPPPNSGPARFDATVYVLMHSLLWYRNGQLISAEVSRPVWVFTDHGRAERHMSDFAFQRAQMRMVSKGDYDEKELIDGQGARLGWGVELVAREAGNAPSQERAVVGREIIWLEKKCLDAENGFEGGEWSIVKTGVLSAKQSILPGKK